MAKSKKKGSKRSALKKPESVENLHLIAERLKEINVPGDLQDRFGSQIERVVARVDKVADNLAKAIVLGATKTEREEKKAERTAKRREKLEAQLKVTQTKLDSLKE